MMEHLDLFLKATPLVAVAIAAYFGLKLRPIEQAIANNKRAIEKAEAYNAAVATKLDTHLRDTSENYHNFDQWRGRVTACLEDNKDDHAEIKKALGELSAEIRRSK